MVVGYAPTIYQSQSLSTLMGHANKHFDGSFSAVHKFDTEEEAREWLTERLWWLYHNNLLDESEFNEQSDHLKGGGSAISYDAAYCKVESLYYSEEREEEEDAEA